jgi:hypothetical protein
MSAARSNVQNPSLDTPALRTAVMAATEKELARRRIGPKC